MVVCIAVYFQFQEGKQVDPNMYGIIQRSLHYLFSQLNQQQGAKIIRASYLEIYNEQVSGVAGVDRSDFTVLNTPMQYTEIFKAE